MNNKLTMSLALSLVMTSAAAISGPVVGRSPVKRTVSPRPAPVKKAVTPGPAKRAVTPGPAKPVKRAVPPGPVKRAVRN